MSSPFIPCPFQYNDIPGGGSQALITVANTEPAVSQNQQAVGSFWLNAEPANAQVPGSGTGNLYYLAGYVSGVPQWELLGTATGALTNLKDTSGTPVTPLSGVIQLLGTTDQVAVTAGSHTLTFSLIGPYTPATYTSHGVLIGEGAASIQATAEGSTGQVLIGATGANPAFGALGVNSSLTSNGVVLAKGNAAFDVTAVGGAGTILTGTGAAPVFSASPTLSGSLIIGTGLLISAGNVVINGAASQLQLHGGAATDFIGQTTLSAGVSPAIANTNIAAGDKVFLSRRGINGSTALGEFDVAITPTTSFQITARKPADATTETGDTSIVDYFIVRQV